MNPRLELLLHELADNRNWEEAGDPVKFTRYDERGRPMRWDEERCAWFVERDPITDR